MKTQSNRRQSKRLGAMLMVTAMLMQTVGPVYATVSQLPGLYITPPPSNVMFTLDDSGSMRADALPDLYLTSTPLLPDTSDSRYGNSGATDPKYPNMWKANSGYMTPELYRKDNPAAPGLSDIARYLRSSDGNPIYYNPKVQYKPWPQAGNNTALMPSANPAAVNIDTGNPLTSNIRSPLDLTIPVGAAGSEATRFWPATFYVYKLAPGTMKFGLPTRTDNPTNIPDNYDKYEITDDTAQTFPWTRADCTSTPGVCTWVEERQNFANWLQYYRNRRLMAKGGAADAFARQGTSLRTGFARIGGSPVVRRGMRDFSGTDRTDFFNLLYNEPSANSTTPLRSAMDAVGQHFTTTDVNSPWAEKPGTSIGIEYTCRRSFHIMSTDGFWNNAAASTAAARANNDSFSGSTPAKPDGTIYTYSDAAGSVFTINPFADGNANTLADVAAYYWKTDLRPTLINNVLPSTRDPAFWQHLTTSTIGLGINGTGLVTKVAGGPADLSTQTARDLLVTSREALNWTLPADDNPATGDDLIHAAMNGRGRYFSATNPTDLATRLSSALAEIGDNPGSLASIAVEKPQVATDTEVYQATYNPSQWSGRLYAFSQSASGAINTKPTDLSYTNPTQVWEASNKMPVPGSRNIYTWNPTVKVGTPFLWGNLTLTQQGNLGNDSTLLDYLRGSDVKELAQGGPFRDRARYTIGAVKGGVLGDIVNGAPIKGPSAGGGYERLPVGAPGQASYATYRSTGNTALDNMRDTLFVGANDGMLHAFNRNNGVERFAFVPNSVFSVPRSLTGTELKLKMLSDLSFSHRYTVDGPPQIGDAFIGAGAAAPDWKTVLLGSTGAGARSVFAMNITNPAVGAGGFDPVTNLMWEYSEADNADVGYVINYPHIARMQNGSWVAIFGNGYDSTNGQAKLFILDLQTGAVLWQQSVGAPGGNGLSQPNFTVNNKREVTAIYAGDLKGNLWKFDVNDPVAANWKVAFGSAPNYAPLFAGTDQQPITVMPEITFHPNGGALVSFGTGKLFEIEDTSTTNLPNINLGQQAIIGIWDKPSETTGISGKADLVQQSMNTGLAAATDTTLTGTTSAAVDWATKRGWFLNLNPSPSGERVNVNPQQAKNTLLIVANTPDIDPCKSGGSSRLFALDPITGGAPNFGVFDSNGVNGINAADRGYNVKSISYAVLSLPTIQGKKPFTDQVVTERLGTRGQTGERLGGVENRPNPPTDCAAWLLAGGSDTSITGFDISLCSPGKPRVSWRQLK